MTHESSSPTRSRAPLDSNWNVCSAVVLQAKNEHVGRPGLSLVAALLECIRLQLRPTIHRSICPGDALSTIGAEECDHVGHIIGFTDSLERLHVECKIAARFLGTTAFTWMPRGPNSEAQCFKGDRSVAALRNCFRGEQQRVAAVVITQPPERLCAPAAIHG